MSSGAVIVTPLGNIAIHVEEGAVTKVQFSDEPMKKAESPLLKQVAVEIGDYFEGKINKFSFVMNPAGTEFQQQVWQKLQEIPFGTTISYQELANRLGDPKCIRAAAAANGKNPIAIAIPCHRVIGSDGSMTGYASGLERKKALLRLEGAAIMSQIDLF